MLLTYLVFNTSRLFYVVIIAKRNTKDKIKLVKSILGLVFKDFFNEQLNNTDKSILTFDLTKVYTYRFKREKVEKELDFFLNYWIKKIDTIPISYKNK
ncbi:MAG: hypothetical protein ACTSO9_17560 [Candidatus Helarchaeota archaeon]